MNNPRFTTLEQWLSWQETLHPQAVDLGLERVRLVAERLQLADPPYRVITVGGTNGKGSCVAFLEAMLRAGGYRVGAYTSPHLLRYNERIRIDGAEIDDATLCQTFARIDAIRGDVSLSYFEFGTLAALEIFRQAQVDVAVLEVGLGGRLDAVNILDTDAAVVTSIDIDHVEWLGSDRNSVGYEKAGIFRRARPAICADPVPPDALLEHARHIGALLYQVNSDYGYRREARGWSWWHGRIGLKSLPLPAMWGEHQLGNAAAALMALQSLSECLPVVPQALHRGLAEAHLDGRFQVIAGVVEWVLDVTHNPHGAATLARCLRHYPCSGHTRAVLGMLKGKDTAAVAGALDSVVDYWYTANLDGPRGQSGAGLAAILAEEGIGSPVAPFSSVVAACRAAFQEAAAGDRIVVLGSFHTVAAALKASVGDSGLLSLTELEG